MARTSKGGTTSFPFRTLRAIWRGWGPGSGCTMSIPIPMCAIWCHCMAEGLVLPYLDVPFPARPSRNAETHGAPGGCRTDAHRDHCLAGRLPRDRHPLDLSSWASPARPRRNSRCFWIGWTRRNWIGSGCFQYEDVEGARSNALPGHVPDEIKEERWHRFMEKAQSNQCRQAGGEGREKGSRSLSTKWTTRPRPAAPRRMRPRSTATCSLTRGLKDLRRGRADRRGGRSERV